MVDKAQAVDTVRSVGAVFVSVVSALIAIWWLALVAERLGLAPVVDDHGTVVLDEFQRAKDILVVVLPLFTASIAYWVGSQGTTEAKEEAKSATEKLNAVVDVSAAGILDAAKKKHPEAFKKP